MILSLEEPYSLFYNQNLLKTLTTKSLTLSYTLFVSCLSASNHIANTRPYKSQNGKAAKLNGVSGIIICWVNDAWILKNWIDFNQFYLFFNHFYDLNFNLLVRTILKHHSFWKVKSIHKIESDNEPPCIDYLTSTGCHV